MTAAIIGHNMSYVRWKSLTDDQEGDLLLSEYNLKSQSVDFAALQ